MVSKEDILRPNKPPPKEEKAEPRQKAPDEQADPRQAHQAPPRQEPPRQELRMDARAEPKPHPVPPVLDMEQLYQEHVRRYRSNVMRRLNTMAAYVVTFLFGFSVAGMLDHFMSSGGSFAFESAILGASVIILVAIIVVTHIY